MHRKRSLSVLALLVLAGIVQGVPPSPAGTAAQRVSMQIPPGWTVFRGQSGLIVPHPAGWTVRERGDGGFAAYRPGQDGGAIALVYVQPIAKIEGRSAGVIQGLGQIAPDLFPNARITQVRVISNKPEVAVGELSCAPRAKKFVGSVLCFKEDPQGVLYAIASTEEAWPQGEAVLKQVLSRFFYAGKGGRAAGPAMVAWRDPLEGAFTCPVPQGWKVEGGMRRFGLADVRSEILATSQDNSILVRIGDAAIPSLMTVPTAFGAQYGFHEGGFETNAFGTKVPILRYLPATAYLTQVYLPQRVGHVSNLKVQNLPQTAGLAYGTTILRDEGYVTFDAQTGTGLRKGGAYIRTGFIPSQAIPNGGTWSVELFYGYLAAPEAEPRVEAILPPMVAGYTVDPVWSARQKEAIYKVHGSVMQAQRETFDIINQAYAERSAGQDRMFESWSRAFRGEVLIQDPTTGEKFEVPAGSNYYFRIGADNAFVGADTATPPDMPNHWLKEMRIGN
jgi:hypothetical protein